MVYTLLSLVFQAYEFLLIIRIVLTWIPHDAYHPVVQGLYAITDPYLNLFRGLPLTFGGFDFSPILAFFALDIIKQIVLKLLFF
jgi:YggT family protein